MSKELTSCRVGLVKLSHFKLLVDSIVVKLGTE